MYSFASNNQEPSDDLFKKPSGFPSRFRKTVNNTQSTFKSSKGEDVDNLVKELGERIEVLGKVCYDRPEYLAEVLKESVTLFTNALYAPLAEKVLSQSNTRAFSSAAFSNWSINTRSSAAPSTSSYAPSIPSINTQEPHESTRRRNNATSKNHFGLLNSAIPEDRPLNCPFDQFLRPNDVRCEPERPMPTREPARSKKTVAAVRTKTVAKRDPPQGLDIVLPSVKPNAAPPPNSSVKYQSSKMNEPEVLPSEDEGDSLSAIFGIRRNLKAPTTARSKPSDKREKPSTSRDLSVSLERVLVSKEKESTDAAGASKKRKASQTDEVPSKKKSPVAVEKVTRPSPDTTTSNLTVRKRPKAANNDTLRRSNRNISIQSTANQKSVPKSKENKENKETARKTAAKPKSEKRTKNAKAKTAPVADKSAKKAPVEDKDAASAKNDEEMLDEESFFGGFSAIDGADSLVLANTMAKNLTKHSVTSQKDMQSHFFSPFANFRSTSGVSAISTPLSKTLTKNVLGKRVKKPNAVAEFKSTQSRKPRKATQPATDVAQVPEDNAESSESESVTELECSDFSN